MNRSTDNANRLHTGLSMPSSTLAAGILGSVLCWLALPPLAWSYLAWIAPIPWLLLVQKETLVGARPYRELWIAGLVYWLLAVHWIRLPYPLNYLGWVLLAGYLGVYLPVFVVLSRQAVHRWRIPIVLAAPVVWTGLDWVRGHLFTGFLMGSLAHTQYRNPAVIQIADFAGEYGVTFLISFTAACITRGLCGWRQNRSGQGIAVILTGAALLTGCYWYGQMRSGSGAQGGTHSVDTRVALIQGNTLADWKSDPERQQQIMEEYVRLSLDAVRYSRDHEHRTVDLIVWPETAFRETLISVAEGYTPPPELLPPSRLTAAQDYLKLLVKELGAAVLVGIDRVEIIPSTGEEIEYRTFNSSVLVDKKGKITNTYDKMHLVPFGEFMPLARWFPFLYQVTPITGGAEPGQAPSAMQVEGVTYSTNICYESAVPHLIRRQVCELVERTGRAPDALVNLTNDAWFWGSSELDMHLACGVFRAVETRTPLLIAANGGLSAHVDSWGKIISVSQRQHPEFLTADLNIPRRKGKYPSPYVASGDWFVGLCVLCCLVLAITAVTERMTNVEIPNDESMTKHE